MNSFAIHVTLVDDTKIYSCFPNVYSIYEASHIMITRLAEKGVITRDRGVKIVHLYDIDDENNLTNQVCKITRSEIKQHMKELLEA